MQYKILKSSFDGISGGGSFYGSIDEVLREISYHRGWDSTEQLHDAIRKWAKDAELGSVFCTQVTAIVAVGVSNHVYADDVCPECGHEGMNYGDIDPAEGGGLEQDSNCPECGCRWKDVFVLTDRQILSRKEEV
jgi:hypothetical protein